MMRVLSLASIMVYYPMDLGGNPQKHDVESIETRIAVARRPDCAECPCVIGLMRVKNVQDPLGRGWQEVAASSGRRRRADARSPSPPAPRME